MTIEDARLFKQRLDALLERSCLKSIDTAPVLILTALAVLYAEFGSVRGMRRLKTIVKTLIDEEAKETKPVDAATRH